MCEGARRLRNDAQIKRAVLDALATKPLSEREIFVRVNGCVDGTEQSRRALNMLVGSGEVARSGVRASFDYGTEILFTSKRKECPERMTCHPSDMLVNEKAESNC